MSWSKVQGDRMRLGRGGDHRDGEEEKEKIPPVCNGGRSRR